MYGILRRLSPLWVLLIASSSLLGQVATGAYPNGTFDSLGVDAINVGNLNVHLAIPVLSKAGRGLPLSANLAYDSSIYYPVGVTGSQVWTPLTGFGWIASTGLLSGAVSDSQYSSYASYNSGSNYYYCSYTVTNAFAYKDALGINHPFSSGSTTQVTYTSPGWTCPVSDNPSTSGTTSDGSGYSLSVSSYTNANVTASDGKQILNAASSAATIVDTNGNEITSDGSGHITDTTGNVALTIAGGAPSPLTYTYQDASGNSQAVTVTYSSKAVQTAFGCSGITEYGPLTQSLVSSISLADGSTYSFTYEPTPGISGKVTGRIASVTLPQGGTISYTYTGSNHGIECADGSAAGLTRTLTANAGSAASTLTYARSAGTNTSQTTVVDGLTNSKIYNFVQASNQPTGASAVYYETSRKIYQGTTSGPLIVARNTCYNGASSPCTTSAVSLPFSQIDTYETLNNAVTHGRSAYFNSNGVLTKDQTFDYGTQPARGSLMSYTTYTYGYSIPALPTEVDVYDGATNLIGKTIYAYDGAAPTPSSGIHQHIAVTAPRGNLTSITQYASSGVSYVYSATYEDTGSLLTSVTPNGTTTLSYDPTFVYVTGTSLPTPSSGVSLSTTQSYDTTYSGLPLVTTDPNSNPTTVMSYNSMLQPTQISYPDGGKTVLGYTSTTLEADAYQTSTVHTTAKTQWDAYGRTSRTVIANGQSTNPWYQQDSCYDANGNVAFSSYKYQGTGLSGTKVCNSSAGDTYTYDVLGRLLTIVRANSETVTYSYNGRATKSVDENSVTRITQIDGLGRPTIVCEISSNSGMPGPSGTPGNCGADIAGTGFTTTYSYTLSTGTTTVAQGSQSRTFQTDWLGRSILVNEPESGQTTYSYLYNTTGLQVTRTRPKAQQTNPAVTTKTTTQYDSVGRVVSVSYDDGITPSKSFVYDVSAGWSIVQANIIGRLSVAQVGPPSIIAGTAYSYDSVGRVVLTAQCVPSGCGDGTKDKHLAYTYDLAGNLTSSTDGGTGSATSTYTVSVANELLTLNTSLYNATNPQHLVYGVINGPNGPTSYTLGNGLTSVSSYDALGRTSGGWLCNGSTSSSCTGGTMSYGFTSGWQGSQLTGSSDSILNQSSSYGYDEFNRLVSRTVNSGTTQNLAWTYDRWGNRWTQTVTAGASAPQPSYSFNTANNRISSSGFGYDAAGHMTNDTSHTYGYDAEGNITQAKTGGNVIAQYVYDALNQRVSSTVGSTVTEFVYNVGGQRVSTWNGATHAQLSGKYYWGSRPVAYYVVAAATHFEHQDWLGTERLRTTYNGGVDASFTSLPFGDAQTTASGTDTDPYHFAQMDSDSETSTDHADFRQYSSTQGRFMRPDSYGGSYSASNPQSFNRYVYALNNPLGFVDPRGLNCYWDDGTEDDSPQDGGASQAECSSGGGSWVDDGGNSPGGSPGPPDTDPVRSPDDITPVNPGNPFIFKVDAYGFTFSMSFPPLDFPNLAVNSSVNISLVGLPQGGGAPSKGNAAKPTSIFDKWPLNGNTLPLTPQPQDQQCTTWSMSGPMNANPAVKSCCQAHDDCYATHQCNATSWIPSFLPSGACNVCNAKAALCIAHALL